MKKLNRAFAPFLLLCSVIVFAQGSSAADSTATSQAIDAWVTDTEEHLVPLADAMPEAKYSFAPTGGEFRNVRTFAEQVKHLAANNYAVSALITAQKPAADEMAETGPDSVRTKAQILDYLKGSFNALHKAVAQINDRNAAEPITGAKADIVRTRLALAIDAIAHSFDHYGQLVEYLRMNGIVPPASR